MSFQTVSDCHRLVARARQDSSFLSSSFNLCSALSGWGTLGALGSSCWFTFVKIPVFPHGFLFHPGGGLFVGAICAFEPDQNQPLISLGWRLGSVKHLRMNQMLAYRIWMVSDLLSTVLSHLCPLVQIKGALNSSILALTCSHSASVSRLTRSMHLFLQSTCIIHILWDLFLTYWHQSPAFAQSLVTAVRFASLAPVCVVCFCKSLNN